MCLAQGPQRSDAGEDEPAAPQSRVKHSTTEPLRSLHTQKKKKKKLPLYYVLNILLVKNMQFSRKQILRLIGWNF